MTVFSPKIVRVINIFSRFLLSYTVTSPGKLRTKSMAVDVVDGSCRGKREDRQ